MFPRAVAMSTMTGTDLHIYFFFILTILPTDQLLIGTEDLDWSEINAGVDTF